MYIVNEYQTNNGTTSVVTPAVYNSINEAESAFHSKLASAAISNVEIHSVELVNCEGFQLKSECYRHEID